MAQKNKSDLTTQANVIKNETVARRNTALRVGTMNIDEIDSFVNKLDDVVNVFNHIYYVKKTGNDSTAVVDDPTLPYLTIKAAALAAHTDQQSTNNWNQVYVFEGVYNEHSIAYPEIEMFFEEWAIVWHISTSPISDVNASGHFQIRGKGKFYTQIINIAANADAINFSISGTSCNIEFAELTSTNIRSNAQGKKYEFIGGRILSPLHRGAEESLTDFINCSFVNAFTNGHYTILGETAFTRCEFIFPTIAEVSVNMAIKDKDGASLFTAVIARKNLIYDTSAVSQQTVIDQVLPDHTLTPDQNLVCAIDFITPDTDSTTGQGENVFRFNDCLAIIRREKGIGFRYSQPNYEQIAGGVYVDGLVVRSEVTNAVAFVNCRGLGVSNSRVVEFNGFIDNASISRGTITSNIDNILGDQNKLDKTDTANQSVVSKVFLQDELGVSNGIAVGSSYSEVQTPPTDGAIFEGNVSIGKSANTHALDVEGDTPAFNMLATANSRSIKITPHNGAIDSTNTQLQFNRFTNNSVIIGGSSTANLGVGVAPLARLDVDQSSLTGAIPVLKLTQADISEEMIKFDATIGTGNPIEAIGAKSFTQTHFLKVYVEGIGIKHVPMGDLT